MTSFLDRKASALTALILSLAISTLPLSAFSAQKITSGATCTSLNKKVTYQNKIYTCIKSGKKLIWNKVVAMKSAAPKTSPTPTPTNP